MTNRGNGADVHFLDGEASRRFASLDQALAFMTTYCPEKLRATAWIVSNGDLLDAIAIRKLTQK